jgi:hypothetical protein
MLVVCQVKSAQKVRMDRRSKIQLASALALLATAAAISILHWRANAVGPQAYFYDLSKKELFVADASQIPPIRGIDNAEEDGVKAVVIAPNEDDKKQRRIAYLERYSPELKRDMEEARAKHAEPMIGREGAQAMRFVRRVSDKDWFPLISPEGQRIVSEWTAAGPNGLSPVVCTP